MNWDKWHQSLGSQPPALASVRKDKDSPLPRSPTEAAQNLAEYRYFKTVLRAPPCGPDADERICAEVAAFVPHAPKNILKFTDDEVAAACRAARSRTAMGVDGIHPCFLKNGGPAVHTSLASLLRESWRLGVVPSSWKRARGVALYKGKGDRADPGNYRLLSITSIVARTAERVIKPRLLSQVDCRLATEQSGFRQRRSTMDNVFRTVRAVYQAMVVSTSCLPCVFLDIAKAFDSVHHDSLLYKLNAIGVRDHMWWWIRGFLADRQLAIWGDGVTSEWFPVPAGVPQGSVLAPILYAIFINDLVGNIIEYEDCECCLFADDVNLWPKTRNESGVEAVARCLDRITTWADTWRAVGKINATLSSSDEHVLTLESKSDFWNLH